jgi:hypothetical protein
MIKKIKYLVFLLISILIVSCSPSSPSEIYFQGQTYDLVNKKISKGGKFYIASYSKDSSAIHLILHKDKVDLDDFAKIYIHTFKSQGFKIKNSGNEYLGIRPSKMVYLTVSSNLNALSILLIDKTANAKTTIEDAADIFLNLKTMK